MCTKCALEWTNYTCISVLVLGRVIHIFFTYTVGEVVFMTCTVPSARVTHLGWKLPGQIALRNYSMLVRSDACHQCGIIL